MTAVGANGTVVHFDGTQWTAQQSGVTEHLFRVWGTGPTDVFAVGDHGLVLHRAGRP